MNKELKHNEFFKILWTLVLPITLQTLISSSLNMVDNVMIGNLGESAIASVGLVNQYFFVFTLCLGGINAGAGIFISQFWGKKNIGYIRKTLGLDLILSIIVSFIFAIPAVLFPETIMGVFTKEAEVVALGVQYIRIISITFILTSLTQAYSTALRCIGDARSPMFGSIIGILTNASLNWIFIFGHLGFPAMGVAGAAIATAIARLVEMIFIIIAAYKSNEVIPGSIKEISKIKLEFIKVFFQTSSSVILNELIWSIGLTFYSVIYAKIGIREVASMQIATTINNLFTVFSSGIAASAAIIIGNQIGAGKEEIAREYAGKLSILAPIVGLITGIVLWISTPSIVNIFNINDDTVLMTIKVLRIMAIITPMRFFTVLMIVGVFRGGGDTTYSMLLQLGTIWLYAIPIGYAAAVYLKLPLEIVYLIICSEEFIKFGFIIYRLNSKKWIKNIIDDVGVLNLENI